MSDYDFDKAFKAAFPSSPTWQPYDFVKPQGLERVVTTTTLVPGDGMAGQAGALGQLAQRSVTTQQLTMSSPTVNATPGQTPTDVSSGRRNHDPFIECNFIIEIDGIEAGAFAKCEGISYECDLIEYKTGMDVYPLKRPGIRRFGNIKLSKGYIKNAALWDWCQSIIQGSVDRRTGALHVLGEDSSKDMKVTYRFIDAWPIKWSGLRFDGKGNANLLEEIEICTEMIFKSSW